METVKSVVDVRLCTGCGTCVAACPTGAIVMKETPAGFLRPVIDKVMCTGCGLCHEVCSGIHYHFPLPDDVDDLFCPSPRRVHLGCAGDPEIHALAQSGGVATALLAFLFERKAISHALVTRIPGDGSLRAQPFFARNRDELLESCGSKYCPNALNAALRNWPDGAARVAVVGLPCHVHGMRNLQHVQPKRWDNAFEVVIGLFCLQISSYLGIDYLVRHGLEGKPVRRVQYRKKGFADQFGHPCIEYADGTLQDFPEDFRSEIFSDKSSPLRCRFCFDKANRTSDLVLGDPHGYSHDVFARGLNVIVVYTQKGEEVLEAAGRAGAIRLFDCDWERVRTGQALLTQRKRMVMDSFAHWRRLGRPTPPVPAPANTKPVRASLSTRVFLRFLWDLEQVSSRSAAYRRLVCWRNFWKGYSRLKAGLAGFIRQLSVWLRGKVRSR